MHLAHKAHGTATAAVEWDVLEPLETEPPPASPPRASRSPLFTRGGVPGFRSPHNFQKDVPNHVPLCMSVVIFVIIFVKVTICRMRFGIGGASVLER